MEKQLLFLLDYDLRMDEEELLHHFSRFLRRPSGGIRHKPSMDSCKTSDSPYPTTPRRSSRMNQQALPTPSPSPVRPSPQCIQPALRSRASARSLVSHRMSPTSSSSSMGSGTDVFTDEMTSSGTEDSSAGEEMDYHMEPKSHGGLRRTYVSRTKLNQVYQHSSSSSTSSTGSQQRPVSGSLLAKAMQAGKGMLSGVSGGRQQSESMVVDSAMSTVA